MFWSNCVEGTEDAVEGTDDSADGFTVEGTEDDAGKRDGCTVGALRPWQHVPPPPAWGQWVGPICEGRVSPKKMPTKTEW